MVSNLVYAAHGCDVVMNMCRGKVIYRNGDFLTIDIERVKREGRRLRPAPAVRLTGRGAPAPPINTVWPSAPAAPS